MQSVQSPSTKNIWAARVLTGMVTFFNVQCAAAFLLRPEPFVGGFELSGVQGAVMVRGMGILFLMWNVPYFFAVLHPIRYRTSLYQAFIMQLIGVTGESLLLAFLPTGHDILASTAVRFIIFDGGGLMALFVAILLTVSPCRRQIVNTSR